ncbi:hypothetical protein ZTR_04749 [Talaromyces verruculosus]|nr:hypothetical protein ZTR_04749 [Talaromyces verruculosus]
MTSNDGPSPPQYEDLDSIQDLLLSFEDDSIITDDSPLARLPRVRSPRSEVGRPTCVAKIPQRPTVLLLQSDPLNPAPQNPSPPLDSTRHVPLCSHDGDDEAHDELSTDARLTFDRSVFKLRYGDDSIETPGTKFSPSKSALHAADLYVL